MFVDASAIIGIVLREPDADVLMAKLARATAPLTSALAVWEAVVGLMQRKQGIRRQDAQAQVQRLLDVAQVRIVAIGEAERDAALDAFERFGKGRHAARLNLGDCFAYACARTHGAPILFKGDDFNRTDLPLA